MNKPFLFLLFQISNDEMSRTDVPLSLPDVFYFGWYYSVVFLFEEVFYTKPENTRDHREIRGCLIKLKRV